jgi:hypothetical protein
MSPTGRLLPQLNVTNATLNLKPNMMVVTLNGGPLLNFAEIIIPAVERVLLNFATNQVRKQLQETLPKQFNDFMVNNDGFVRLGAVDNVTFPADNPWAHFTVDCSLDPDVLIQERYIQFGINGSFFNNDTGFKTSNKIPTPTSMPIYDPEIPSQLQVFFSNWAIDSFMRAFFEKTNQYITYTLYGVDYQDPPAAFVSDTVESIFPFVTTKFGYNVTTDITFYINNITNFTCYTGNKTDRNNETGIFIADLYLEAEAILAYKNGTNFSLGFAEFHDVHFSGYINQTNQTLIGMWIHEVIAAKQWLRTSYMGRFPSSPLVINWATYVLADIFNYDMF